MLDRRTILAAGALPALARQAHAASTVTCQVACTTYVYRRFPLRRALEGIAGAGFRFVAWGTEHREADGRSTPVMPPDAHPSVAAALAKRCRSMGLEPVMLFSTIYPEHQDGLTVLRRRIQQAEAARIPQVLTFGHIEKDGRDRWRERFRLLGPEARKAGVTIVIKQHGGESGTGDACARFTRELGESHVKVNYDAGNVMDYLNIDPIPDLRSCLDEVRSFCIKDHRNSPKDEDCGPGFGEIDHYRLLDPAINPRLVRAATLPLCCENIFPPLLGMPTSPSVVDDYARRARVFLETVIAGLRKSAEES